MHSSKISKKGQIVIPQEIREKLKIDPGDTLLITTIGNRISIEKEENPKSLPKMVDILMKGKSFPQNLIKSLRDEWE